MTTSRLWILGASDPEMAAIERLLADAGERVAYAVGPDGQRVHPGNAYRADAFVAGSGHELPEEIGPSWTVYQVECNTAPYIAGADYLRIDHHRPGDPGYGRPPAEFFAASSIGQALAALVAAGYRPSGKQQSRIRVRADRQHILADVTLSIGTPRTDLHGGCSDPGHCLQHDGHDATGAPMVGLALTISGSAAHHRIVERLHVAAADHCLEAAYRGRCPGVDPDALMRWRTESRAAYQGRPVEAVLADVGSARERLRSAMVADLRGESIPELPEAAAQLAIPFLASITDRDGRQKTVLQAAPPELVARFLAGELVPGLVDMYGDPARGFAGGYSA